MDDTNFYNFMGLSRDATQEDIRRAYRFKARLLHPDKSGKTDAGEFQQLQVAYENLSDSVKKEQYDRVLDMKAAYDCIRSFVHCEEFELTLEQMYHGVSISTINGTYTVPRGVQEGVLTVQQGLFALPPLRIKQLKHEYFVREGADLNVLVPLTLKQSLLGARVVLQGIDGQFLSVDIPKGNTQCCTIPGMGMPKGEQKRGDVHVICNLQLPLLSPLQESIIDKYF